jgi:hypothetical protein
VERLKALADSVTKAGGALKYQALDVTSLEDMQRFVAFAERFRDQTALTIGAVTFDIETCRVIRDGG